MVAFSDAEIFTAEQQALQSKWRKSVESTCNAEVVAVTDETVASSTMTTSVFTFGNIVPVKTVTTAPKTTSFVRFVVDVCPSKVSGGLEQAQSVFQEKEKCEKHRMF